MTPPLDHELSDHARHVLDAIVWTSAGLAVLNVHTVLTVTALCISIILGCIRIYDRLKYGPARGK